MRGCSRGRVGGGRTWGESGKGHTLLYGCQTLSPSVSALRTPCFAVFLREEGSREAAARGMVLDEVI